MKKYYKFGEIILALREEYKECKGILDELKSCINVKSDYNNFYFSGELSNDKRSLNLEDKKISLIVEKEYLDILKKIHHLRYSWYAQYLYSAMFYAEKKDNGLYKLEYDNRLTCFDRKKYRPEVDIIDESKFSELIDELLSYDLFQVKEGYFNINSDALSLSFDNAFISSSLGDESLIFWDGVQDTFSYTIKRHNSFVLIDEILSLEMPADKISPDWLKLLEKHENDFGKEVLFSVDINAQSKKGILQISNEENNGVVRLLKKSK